MKRTRRKPVPKSIEAATEALYWRAKNLIERHEYEPTTRPNAEIRLMKDAIEDYELAKFPVNGHAQQMELQERIS